jgi:hypothetical protein
MLIVLTLGRCASARRCPRVVRVSELALAYRIAPMP